MRIEIRLRETKTKKRMIIVAHDKEKKERFNEDFCKGVYQILENVIEDMPKEISLDVENLEITIL